MFYGECSRRIIHFNDFLCHCPKILFKFEKVYFSISAECALNEMLISHIVAMD